MKQEDLKYFEKLLTEWLDQLLNQSKASISELRDSVATAPDPVDRASQESDQGYTIMLREREGHLINKIGQSLKYIETGTYGFCELCGEEISIARLKARPVTNYCAQCKTEMEAIEKASES
jgi:DnaK suppressor protein